MERGGAVVQGVRGDFERRSRSGRPPRKERSAAGGQQGPPFVQVSREEDEVARGEEPGFLGVEVGRAVEVFEVGVAEVGQAAEVGADAVGQAGHFAGVGNAGLDEGDAVGGANAEEGDRDADLAVEAAGAPVDAGAEEVGEPFLDHGFAVAPGEGEDGNAGGRAPGAGGVLGSEDGVRGDDDIGAWQEARSRIVGDDESADACGVGCGEVVVPVVPNAAHRQENCGRCRKRKGPRIEHQVECGGVVCGRRAIEPSTGRSGPLPPNFRTHRVPPFDRSARRRASTKACRVRGM